MIGDKYIYGLCYFVKTRDIAKATKPRIPKAINVSIKNLTASRFFPSMYIRIGCEANRYPINAAEKTTVERTAMPVNILFHSLSIFKLMIETRATM